MAAGERERERGDGRWFGRYGSMGDGDRWSREVTGGAVHSTGPDTEDRASTGSAPGHDSRAPVFEYNALYCPRHIIYLPAK